MSLNDNIRQIQYRQSSNTPMHDWQMNVLNLKRECMAAITITERLIPKTWYKLTKADREYMELELNDFAWELGDTLKRIFVEEAIR